MAFIIIQIREKNYERLHFLQDSRRFLTVNESI